MIVLWILTAIYVFFILFLRFGMSKLPEWETEHFLANTHFSIVVPFRNEAQNLPALLQSVAELNYPKEKYELILIDDASEDDSVIICQKFFQAYLDIRGEVLSANPSRTSPKKAAIETGIRASNFEYILTIDADCILAEGHLAAYDAQLLREEADMLVGPVAFPKVEMSKRSGFLTNFQSLDLLSLQAATQGGVGIGKPFLCNGANLCYSKKRFEAVNGFLGNDSIASGDDIFMLEKFLEANLRVAYVKNKAAVVRTHLHTNWSDLLSQRVRWAAKTTAYRNRFGKWIGLLVFLTNLAFVLGIPAMLFGVLEPQHYFIAYVFKFNTDFLLLFPTASFLGMESPMKSYLWGSMVYPFFSTWVALRSLFSEFCWKGRRFKR